MSNLPSMTQTISKFKEELSDLRRGKQGEHSRPHKLVMMLSVIELVDRGLLTENKIYLSPQLLAIFEHLFVLVKRKNDLCQPGPPFFHLRSSGFWFHKVRSEQEKDYALLSTTGGGLQMVDKYIEYAYLRDDIYEMIMNDDARKRIRLFIANMLNTHNERE